MTVTTLRVIRRASLAHLINYDRNRMLNALKTVRRMTVVHGSPAEAPPLAKIANYWAS